MLAILLERGVFYEQLMYDIIIHGTIFIWNIHVQKGKGSMNLCKMRRWSKSRS